MYIEKTSNKKLGNIAATYAPIEQSCPSSCELKKLKVCYAGLGYVGIHNKRLEKQLKGKDARDVARLEKKEIENAKIKHGRPLRLHVSGDCRTNTAAKLLAQAANTYYKKGGGPVFTYTHAWREVKKSSWGKNISVLASVDSLEEADRARSRGYAPAAVVSEFESEKAYTPEGTNTKFIPCPEQTRGVTCEQCKLCMDANRLLKNKMGILFKAHGVNKDKIKDDKKHLKVAA